MLRLRTSSMVSIVCAAVAMGEPGACACLRLPAVTSARGRKHGVMTIIALSTVSSLEMCKCAVYMCVCVCQACMRETCMCRVCSTCGTRSMHGDGSACSNLCVVCK